MVGRILVESRIEVRMYVGSRGILDEMVIDWVIILDAVSLLSEVVVVTIQSQPTSRWWNPVIDLHHHLPLALHWSRHQLLRSVAAFQSSVIPFFWIFFNATMTSSWIGKMWSYSNLKRSKIIPEAWNRKIDHWRFFCTRKTRILTNTKIKRHFQEFLDLLLPKIDTIYLDIRCRLCHLIYLLLKVSRSCHPSSPAARTARFDWIAMAIRLGHVYYQSQTDIRVITDCIDSALSHDLNRQSPEALYNDSASCAVNNPDQLLTHQITWKCSSLYLDVIQNITIVRWRPHTCRKVMEMQGMNKVLNRSDFLLQ